MANVNLFTPRSTGTTSVTCSSAASSRVAMGQADTQHQVAVYNSDVSNMAFVEFGTSTVTAVVPNGATPGSMPVGPGQTRGVTISPSVTHAAAICTGGTPVVYFTPGDGT